MAKPQMLRVLPVGTALVTNYEALAAGTKAFIGRKPVRDADGNVTGFDVVDGPVEIPMTGDYILELRQGMLEPADEATAKLAGVPFKAAKSDDGPALKSSK